VTYLLLENTRRGWPIVLYVNLRVIPELPFVVAKVLLPEELFESSFSAAAAACLPSQNRNEICAYQGITSSPSPVVEHGKPKRKSEI